MSPIPINSHGDISFPFRYPSEAPKGKGGRVSVGTGVAAQMQVPGLGIVDKYRQIYSEVKATKC